MSLCSLIVDLICSRSEVVMVFFLMVIGNMTHVYQNKSEDGSKKCKEVKKAIAAMLDVIRQVMEDLCCNAFSMVSKISSMSSCFLCSEIVLEHNILRFNVPRVPNGNA